MTDQNPSPRWQNYLLSISLSLVVPQLFPMVMLIFYRVPPWDWFGLLPYFYSPGSPISILIGMIIYVALPPILAVLVTSFRGIRAGLRTAAAISALSGTLLLIGLKIFLDFVSGA
jgi:hypothetical protein